MTIGCQFHNCSIWKKQQQQEKKAYNNNNVVEFQWLEHFRDHENLF